MRSKFSLFQSHLDLAHHYWSNLVKPGDTVIDATCGNGYDTLRLATMIGPTGRVYAYDIQPAAIEMTGDLLTKEGLLDRVELRGVSHISFEGIALPRLIVYNLGYLPGSDKQIKTVTETTLLSIAHGLEILQPGGMISITAYPGHEEGALEEQALQIFFSSLSPTTWSCTFHKWLNRQQAPVLFLIQKKN